MAFLGMHHAENAGKEGGQTASRCQLEGDTLHHSATGGQRQHRVTVLLIVAVSGPQTGSQHWFVYARGLLSVKHTLTPLQMVWAPRRGRGGGGGGSIDPNPSPKWHIAQ